MNDLAECRPQPLAIADFHKLTSLAERFMTVREKLISKSVPVLDHAGNPHKWERDLVPVGVEVFFKTAPDERVMESLMRPSAPMSIGKHLQDLYDHKLYGRGDHGWQTVVRDMIHDLRGCSEWALLKTCQHFRLSRNSKFFPDTADLVHAVKNLDEQIRWAYAARAPKERGIEPPKPPEVEKPTDAGRARVAKTLHDAGLPHDGEFCAQCREDRA